MFMNLNQYDIYNLTQYDIIDAIRSACDFFRIPMPCIIRNQTGECNGSTCFVDSDSNSFLDDEIRLNMNQLIGVHVNTKQALSLVMTHECAHRVFQNTTFYGLNNGAWENELCADFFMGVRAGMCNMGDINKIAAGLYCTEASSTHPEGALRAIFVRHGKYAWLDLAKAGIPLTIQNLFDKFNLFLNNERHLIRQYQNVFFA